MQHPVTSKTTTRASSPRTGCCADPECRSGLRNDYFKGKKLTADSFRVEQRYLNQRRRLLSRAVHGWGVVYGYQVRESPPDQHSKDHASGRLWLGPGLTLDPCGRELVQTGWRSVGPADLIIFDEKGARCDCESAHRSSEHYERASRKSSQQPRRRCWLLSAHYAEEKLDAVTVHDPCTCERQEWDHVCETVRYSLRPIDCDECCDSFDCELECDCGTGPCCCDSDEPPDQGKDERHPEVRMPQKRGGCRCLCDHLTSLPIEQDCDDLCEIDEPCGSARVDLRNGVPLACVRLTRDDCDRVAFDDWVDSCGPRRLVKRNDLLFDLIRGCDLTRISEIGWSEWHRREDPVAFKEFSEALGPAGDNQSGYTTEKFWVAFSRPVRGKTVRRDCFTMTVLSSEDEGGWLKPSRVPIVDVKLEENGAPPGHVNKATIVVDGGWVEDAVRGRRTIFMGEITSVEIEVRGDFIVDCNGLTLDANAVGLSPAPSGNGAPGGTFVSTFRVARHELAARANAPGTAQSSQGGRS